MHLRSVYIIVYLGFLGFVVFLAFRPVIDMYAGAPVEVSKKSIIAVGNEKLQAMGLQEATELNVIPRRIQRKYLYTDLLDSLGKSQTLNPSALNRSGMPLSGWSLFFTVDYEDVTAILGDEQLFQQVGLVIMTFDYERRLRSMRVNSDRNRTFIPAESHAEAVSNILHLAGHDPHLYRPAEGFDLDLPIGEDPYSGPSDDLHGNNYVSSPSSWIVTMEKISPAQSGAESIQVRYKEAVGNNADRETGVRIERLFASYSPLDLDTPVTSDVAVIELFLTYLFVFFVIISVAILGLRLIFRGEVIWYRGIVILCALIVLYMLTRYVTMTNTYYTVLESNMIMLDMLFYFIGSLLFAGLVAMGYMIWDANARKQNQEQIPHIDALWRGIIFQRRIGKAILAGFGYAGFSLGLWAIAMYSVDSIYFQNDTFMGFMDVSANYPALATVLGAAAHIPLVSYVFVGVTMTLLTDRIKNSALLVLVGSLIIGVLMSRGFEMVSTTGSIQSDIFVFSMMAIPLVMAYRYYGVITVGVAVWVIYLMLRLGVYYNSSDPFIYTQGWILIGFIGAPFVVGFVLHHFGRDSLASGSYVPEYEHRIKQQLRLEREFQIAKESQFALMPKSSPVLEGIDVKGVFIPSLEVGGDFYDHVVVRDKDGKPEEIVLTVVDVSGKAMKAALTAIFTSGLLLSRSRNPEQDPATILSDVNPVLHERTDAQSFITCLLSRYNLQTREFTFVNAGHCQPILKRKGEARFLTSSDPRLPLGFRKNVEYKSTRMQLEAGDLLFLYSDGMPEARASSGDLYGFDTVLELLNEIDTDQMTAKEVCDFVKQQILEFSDYELADDMTILVMKT